MYYVEPYKRNLLECYGAGIRSYMLEVSSILESKND